MWMGFLVTIGIGVIFSLQVLDSLLLNVQFHRAGFSALRLAGKRPFSPFCTRRRFALQCSKNFNVTILLQAIVPPTVFFSIIVLLVFKLRMLFIEPFSSSKLVEGSEVSSFSVWDYLLYSSWGIRWVLLCVVSFIVSTSIFLGGTAAFGVSYGLNEMQNVMRIRHRERATETLSKGCPFLSQFRCQKEECSLSGRYVVHPDRWYSRHFGFRRGRFFFYRMFVSEMVEWIVQGLTLNSLEHQACCILSWLCWFNAQYLR